MSTSSALVKELKITPISVPKDEQDSHYCKSFTVDQDSEILKFFKEYGFVVVRDVLTLQQCKDSVSEIFSLFQANGFEESKPETWFSNKWPETGMEQYGSPQREPLFTKQLLLNRQNPNILKAFSILYQTSDLIVNHDRCCLYRPTKQVKLSDGTTLDFAQVATKPNVHLDMNPWHYLANEDSCNDAQQFQNLSKLTYGAQGNHLNHFIFENNQISKSDGLMTQAVLNLVDNYEEDGGYVVIPKFHNYFEAYFSKLKQGPKDVASYSFFKNDPLFTHAVRIAMRPGSIVIWDQRMPHGSFANNSGRVRCAQFLKMFPYKLLKQMPKRESNRSETIWKQIWKLKLEHGYDFPLNETGKQVFFGNNQQFVNLQAPKWIIDKAATQKRDE